MFQAGIIKLCNKEKEGNRENTQNGSNSELEERVAKIENYLRSGSTIRAGGSRNTGTSTNISNQLNRQQKSQTKQQQANPSFSKETQKFWPEIVNNIKTQGKMGLYTNLIGTVATELNDMTIGIEFPNGMSAFGKTVLEKPESIKIISDMVSIAKGKEMHIKYIEGGNNTLDSQNNVETIENFANGMDLPFNVID